MNRSTARNKAQNTKILRVSNVFVIYLDKFRHYSTFFFSLSLIGYISRDVMEFQNADGFIFSVKLY